MAVQGDAYAARLDVDYPEEGLDRVTSFFRVIWIIPIAIIIGLLSGGGGDTTFITDTGAVIQTSGGGIAGGLAVATALMIVFRQRYPRW